ncbi:hypothetical protein [Spirosoma sordidisoli]|uniref:Lipoprotein n=1 Tax=Spirosoma sordidisoli TaxID=2502893 RepID=A0A4V1RWF1_9BACT|nr:hypothetical protein [Spirosoma sordidisoli]RYC70048.1 hypothetical protein EQG79_09260 [Spirosoma sordidisoli]
MIKNLLTTASGRWCRAGFALSILFLSAACQHEVAIKPDKSVVADSTMSMSDPPVQPGGPGGGK